MRKYFPILMLLLTSIWFSNALTAQNVQLEGYAFEAGNRGFLNLVSIKVFDLNNNQITSTASDMSGIFNLSLPTGQDFILVASKDIFKERKISVSTVGKVEGEKLYIKVEMTRQPGYIFDVTLAANRTKKQIKQGLPADAISGARIEVFNNTKEKQVLDIKDSEFPNFKIHFEDGNHYTIMVRKKGFFTKRMEAYVNVEGCILCFDGVGEVKPGVSDIMTEENTMGTLLANVEMQKVELNKAIKVENIYYNKNSAKIRDDAALELDKLIQVLKDNPTLMIELGSHTDARGDRKFNQKLSQQRAESAVRYITGDGSIDAFRIKAKGYGESKLVNSCGDGVDCSERRHQMNRRTEIKVTGVLAEDPYKNKSLSQIIDGENYDKLMEEILNQEIVEIKPGEDLPDHIKREIEQQNNPDKEKVNVETPISPVPEKEEEVIEKVEIVSVPPSSGDNYSSAGNVKIEKEKTSSRDLKVDAKTSTPQPETPVIRKPSKDNSSSSISGDSKIVSDLEVNSSYRPKAPSKLENKFTGYMVEFFTASSELPSSHEIFTRHGKIYQEVTKDGSYSYLFGPFGEWRDANKFLVSAVSENYTNAKVIRYKNGKRVTRK